MPILQKGSRKSLIREKQVSFFRGSNRRQWMKDRQSGAILNGLNSRQSEMFSEFPPEGSFKPLKSISLEILHVSIGFLFLFFQWKNFPQLAYSIKNRFALVLMNMMKQLNEMELPLSRLRMYIFTTKSERRTSEKLNDLRKGNKSV